MDLKKTIGRLSKDAILKQAAKEAVNKILPMEEDKPKFGWKAKAASAAAAIAVIAGALSQLYGS